MCIRDRYSAYYARQQFPGYQRSTGRCFKLLCSQADFTASGRKCPVSYTHLAYLTAVGTMSSAATLAVALRCAKKSEPELRDDMVDFGIPLFANIHLCGSVLTEVFFVMVVSKILYGELPSVGSMILFCILLGVFAIGAPGVPGGTVMASLGLRCV